jgi:hypothetical protein
VIFEADQAKLLLSGRKSVTLRSRWKRAGARPPYTPKRAYSIRVIGEDAPRSSKVTVLDVREGTIAGLSLAESRAAGFRTPGAASEWWREHAQLAEDIWVISIRLGDHTDRPRLLRAGAPSAATCQKKVKVVVGGEVRSVVCGRGFIGDAGTCSRGHSRPAPSPEDSGYTSSPARAMRDVGEEVPAHLQDIWSADAQLEQLAVRVGRANERGNLTAGERLSLLEADAIRLGVDVTSEVRVIEQRLRRAEGQVGDVAD